MSSYDIVKFIHLLGVISLFAGTAIVLTSMLFMRRATTVEHLRDWSRIASALTMLVPGTIFTILLPGAYMVERRWGWDNAWINIALAAYLIMLPLAPAINARRLAAVHRFVRQAPDGPIPPSLARQIHDPVLWTSVQTMTAADLGIVFLMTTKPGTTGALLAMMVALLLGVLSSMPSWRPRRVLDALPDGAAEPREV